MGTSPQPHIYKFSVPSLSSSEQAEKLRTLLETSPGTEQIDININKKLVRIISSQPLSIDQLNSTLSQQGFNLHFLDSGVLPPPVDALPSQLMKVGIEGMTCHSCEVTIERKWKKLPGVKTVTVNAAHGQAELSVQGNTPSIADLQRALGNDSQYTVHHGSKKSGAAALSKPERPSWLRLLGLFALVFVIGQIFSKLGLLKTSFSVGGAMSFGAIFIVGLVAASSSCIAITGGLLLSAAAKFNERYASARPLARMRPVFLFVAGRILSYTILGGLLGVVGAALSPSPTVTAIIAIIAAVYMLIMGLDMLGLAPGWLKKSLPRLPKSISHRIMDAEGKEHPLAPFGLGAATFFLPCGFTQALQLYALTTGSFATGAVALLAFALGTAPALLALGWASSSLKGKAGRFFFQFSGALVVVLGLWNIQNGLSILGHPLSFPTFTGTSAEASNGSGDTTLSGTMDGATQVIKMGFSYGNYSPNHFTLRAGVPVRWEVDGTGAGGCTSVLVSRQLGIQKLLAQGTNTIEFTPTQAGDVQFSCSMGMIRGSFKVLPSII